MLTLWVIRLIRVYWKTIFILILVYSFLFQIIPKMLSSSSTSTPKSSNSQKNLNNGNGHSTFPTLQDISTNGWLEKENLSQDDPSVVEHIREVYLIPPAPDFLPYVLINNRTDPSDVNASQTIWPILANIANGRPGFFVECGANDGEVLSNTLWMEREKGWRGLLIEPSHLSFAKIKGKDRKAWSMNVCLSLDKTPKKAIFYYDPQDRDSGLLMGWQGRQQGS